MVGPSGKMTGMRRVAVAVAGIAVFALTGCELFGRGVEEDLRRHRENAAAQREMDRRDAECRRTTGRACEDPMAAELRRERQQQGAAQARTAGLPDHLDRAMIERGLDGVHQAVLACGTKFAAKGTVEILVEVGATGQVVRASIQTTPDPDLGTCVTSAMASAVFAKTRRGGSFIQPVVF